MSDLEAVGAERRLRLRYAGGCRACGASLPAGTDAFHDPTTSTVRCLDCRVGPLRTVPVEPAPSRGVAGASARREYERRRSRKQQEVMAQHPKLGGLLLALKDEPHHTRTWVLGAEGEEKLGRRLDKLSGRGVHVLHDRRIPGTRANIDHLVVCPSGVLVVDAKNWRGRPERKAEGGLFRPRTERLVVGRRDGTKQVDGVRKQVALVRGVLHAEPVRVHGLMCFVGADWPLFGGAFRVHDVGVLKPSMLTDLVSRRGPVTADLAVGVAEALAAHFPAA